MYDRKLLDCTLRDGGYINEWKWGFDKARDIIHSLVRANVDIVEVGFLRNVDNYDPDITVCNHIEELNRLLPASQGNTMFSAMAMRSNYDIRKLSTYAGNGIEMIRITAHDYDIVDGMDFAREVKEKGYKLSINPINIMGYNDRQLLWICEQVNKIMPYQFSIVDTFGSMRRRDLDRIVSLVDNNIDSSIRLALHLHENMSLACCLAQNFLDKHLNRDVTVDGSLDGMGRVPGNLPIELIADYCNEYLGKHYDIDYLMDAIQDQIAPIKSEIGWGYTPAYFLSARYNLHRNYAEHYINKGDLTNRDINHILARFDRSKTTAFDPDYADKLYEEYKFHIVDDTQDISILTKALSGKDVLILAPGSTLRSHSEKIKHFISVKDPVVIAANFMPKNFCVNYAFFSNNRRFSKLDNLTCPAIITSNLGPKKGCFIINYNRLAGAFMLGDNSLILLLRLLHALGAKHVVLAGADGYKANSLNYVSSSMNSHIIRDEAFNRTMAEAIRNCGIPCTFLTPSYYDEGL